MREDALKYYGELILASAEVLALYDHDKMSPEAVRSSLRRLVTEQERLVTVMERDVVSKTETARLVQ